MSCLLGTIQNAGKMELNWLERCSIRTRFDVWKFQGFNFLPPFSKKLWVFFPRKITWMWAFDVAPGSRKDYFLNGFFSKRTIIHFSREQSTIPEDYHFLWSSDFEG